MKRMTDGTIVISVPEDDLAITGRVILEAGRWCKTFYPDEPRQRGRWIYELEDWNRWTCSECGFSKRTDVHIRLGYNYCPRCGADMRQREEQE